MNSKVLLEIRNKLKNILSDKKVLDIIVFGSLSKGSLEPADIDICILTQNMHEYPPIEGFHSSVISVDDFFKKELSLINTLLREGFSLRHNKPFAGVFRFESKCLFSYELTGLSNALKVKISTILHGKGGKGLVESYKGVWLARQIFHVDTSCENVFLEFFNKQEIKYKKNYILLH